MKTVNLRYTLLSAALAFCLWGSWALYVNASLDPAEAIRAGCVQGTMSFILTIIMIRLIMIIYHYSPLKTRLWLPPILTVCGTGTLLYSVHTLAHTPYILKTILPPLIVALSFCWFTNYKFNLSEIKKNERNKTPYQD